MSWRFITCAALFVTCLLTANTIATKLITVGGVVLTAGIVIFPLSYVLGDVLTEVWGYTVAADPDRDDHQRVAREAEPEHAARHGVAPDLRQEVAEDVGEREDDDAGRADDPAD